MFWFEIGFVFFVVKIVIVYVNDGVFLCMVVILKCYWIIVCVYFDVIFVGKVDRVLFVGNVWVIE